jgi:hypothetical protein
VLTRVRCPQTKRFQLCGGGPHSHHPWQSCFSQRQELAARAGALGGRGLHVGTEPWATEELDFLFYLSLMNLNFKLNRKFFFMMTVV